MKLFKKPIGFHLIDDKRIFRSNEAALNRILQFVHAAQMFLPVFIDECQGDRFF